MPVPPTELIRAFRHRARKALGQNFLTDAAALREISQCADIGRTTTVLEIGPGPGGLTQELLRQAACVVAIEKDPRAVAFLQGSYASMVARAEHLTVIEGDAMDVDLLAVTASEHDDRVAVGNLPFNVGTAILNRLLAQPGCWRRWVFMFQREVALRLVAEPNHKTYGSLSLAVQSRCRPSYVLEVPPEAFDPAPKVHCAVVAFDHTHPPRVPVHLQPSFDRIVRQSFATRRKTLRNNLKRALGEDTDPVLDAVNLDGRRRPETLSLDEFVALAMAVEERNTP